MWSAAGSAPPSPPPPPPPCPPQDLARLVLSYLESEECMTAHDEFLKTSPYLDYDRRSEYNNVVMTSLHDILNEFCSCRLYIGNCQPLVLRARLKHKSLLDAITFLVKHFNLKKLQSQPSDNHNQSSQTFVAPPVQPPKTKECELCKTIDNIEGCRCKARQPIMPNLFATPFKIAPHNSVALSTMPLETLVETTQLCNLPGNVAAKGMTYKEQSPSGYNSTESAEQDPMQLTETQQSSDSGHNQIGDDTDDSSPDPHQPMDTNSQISTLSNQQPPAGKNDFVQQSHIPNAGEDINNTATSSEVISVSSTLGTHSQIHAHNQHIIDARGPHNPSTTFPIAITPNLIVIDNNQNMGNNNFNSTSDVEMKEQNTNSSISTTKLNKKRIKILSNDIVKPIEENGQLYVSRPTGEKAALKVLPGRPPGVHTFKTLANTNAIIQVNGTPVFNSNVNQVFTKEQIMGMPTLIVLQTSTSSRTTSSTVDTIASLTAPAETHVSTDLPLIIDVDSPNQTSEKARKFIASEDMPTMTVSLEKPSTPNCPKLVKKSSSTPRRSSHVRVLDFTTPRRILTSTDGSEEPAVSLSSIAERSQQNDMEPQNNDEIIGTVDKPPKRNWDTDLRALALSGALPPTTTKKKYPKKKKSPGDSSKENNETNVKQKGKKKKKIKSKVDEHVKNAVKPISLVSDRKPEKDEERNESSETVQHSNKVPDTVQHSDNDPETYSTPEIDVRAPISNPPSAKHNLSDFFLQTPIKMMLENMQIQTPRYIDPSILDQPISDIKIDSIPTPTFLNTPNVLLTPRILGATPSSYSSRPTDYSSGSSYYRPDEQDYVPPVDFTLPTSKTESQPKTKSNESEKIVIPEGSKKQEISSVSRSSRPRRTCTMKKVSYRTTPTPKKKGTDNKSFDSTSNVTESQSESSDDDHTNIDSVEKSHSQSRELIKSKEESQVCIEAKKTLTIALNKSPKKKPRKKNVRSPNKSGSRSMARMSTSKPTIKKKASPTKVETNERQTRKSMCKDKSTLKVTIPITTVPAKSRRKSLTPRKFQKTDEHFNADSIDESASTDVIKENKSVSHIRDKEQLPPHRMSSDDGSCDSKAKSITDCRVVLREEVDEIIQIKAYIERTSEKCEPTCVDLIKRGFDIETAKLIERDLMDTPPLRTSKTDSSEVIGNNTRNFAHEVSTETDVPKTNDQTTLETRESSTNQDSSKINATNESSHEGSSRNENSIVIDREIELSSCQINEESDNFITCVFDESDFKPKAKKITIDDDFRLQVDFEDSPEIQIKLVKGVTVYDIPPEVTKVIKKNTPASPQKNVEEPNNDEEIETANAVDAIAYMYTPLYTPMKDDRDRQCKEIFDSTLDSLDTPIKHCSEMVKSQRISTDMDLTPVCSRYSPNIKRKRSSSPNHVSSKKSRPEFLTIQCQNIDIESVLSKLHGP